MNGPATVDTNIAIYAALDEPKSATATGAVRKADFISVQVLNEFANALHRKQRRHWRDVAEAISDLRVLVPLIVPIDDEAHREALRIAARYQLSFYDALMLAVALSGGARTFYSEDMQHGMTIDEALRVVDPFIPGALDA